MQPREANVHDELFVGRSGGPTTERRLVPHGYCTGCDARVTVREGSCLLGHPIESSTIRFDSGRRVSTRRNHVKTSRRTAHPPTEHPPASPMRARPISARPAVATAIAPTSEMVARLWTQTAEMSAVEDWRPGEVALNDRKARPARVIALLLAIAVAGGAAWWTTVGRETVAAGQLSNVRAEARSLEAALSGVEFVTSDMADGRVDDRTTAALALAALDRHARALFQAAGGLPDGEGSMARLKAIDASETALGVASLIGNTAAYQTGFEVAAKLPAFPTTAPLEDIPSVATDTAWWIAEFRQAVSSLPATDGLVDHRTSSDTLAQSLDAWQRGYLDALAAGDGPSAEASLKSLSDGIGALQLQLTGLVKQTSASAQAMVAGLTEELAALSR